MDQGLSTDTAALSRAKQAPPCRFVIFGAGGDLTRRLLMPALYNLRLAGLLDDAFSIVGVDAREMDDAAFRDHLGDAMSHFVTERRGDAAGRLDQPAWDWMCERLTYLSGDFANPDIFARLGALFAPDTSVVFYCATAARFFDVIAEQLHRAGLLAETNGAFRRLVVEKPFGHDLPSAKRPERCPARRDG